MIYPVTLYNYCLSCEDSMEVGNVLRALCKQKVKLSAHEALMVKMIQHDSEWMDERIDDKREKSRRRQAERRSNLSRDVTVTKRDNAMSHVQSVTGCDNAMSHVQSVTGCDNALSRPLPSSLPPSLPSSLPAMLSTDTDVSYESVIAAAFAADARAMAEHFPTQGEVKMAALQQQVAPEFLAEFFETLRKQGYAYNNRHGELVPVYPKNFKVVLATFWRQYQKRAAEEKQREARAAVPGIKHADNWVPLQDGDDVVKPF